MRIGLYGLIRLLPASVLNNPLVLALLGILIEGPAHPYQLHLELKKRGLVSDRNVSRGTLYNVVVGMQNQGWILPGTQDRGGNRPDRVPFRLTEEGKKELRRRLDQQIREPVWSADPFFHAMSHVGALGRVRARNALRERSANLQEQIQHDAQAYTKALQSGAPRLFVIEAEYALHRKRAELSWVTRIAEEIESGDLRWPKQKL